MTTTSTNSVSTTYTIDTLKLSQLTFTDQMKTKTGLKRVYINAQVPGNSRGNRILLQTPLMSTPFGLSRFTPKSDSKSAEPAASPGGYSVQLSFNDRETNPKTNALYELIHGIEELVKQRAVENSLKWFGKKMSHEVVDALFSTSLPMPKDPKYQPTFRVKVDSDTANGETKWRSLVVYDENRNKVDPLSSLTKHARGRFIIQCDNIWFMDKAFGVKWSLQQVRLSPRTTLPDYAFVPDSDEESVPSDAPETALVPEPTVASPVASPVASHPSDQESEEEDSDDDELSSAQEALATPAPLPVAPATVPKRTVLKKK